MEDLEYGIYEFEKKRVQNRAAATVMTADTHFCHHISQKRSTFCFTTTAITKKNNNCNIIMGSLPSRAATYTQCQAPSNAGNLNAVRDDSPEMVTPRTPHMSVFDEHPPVFRRLETFEEKFYRKVRDVYKSIRPFSDAFPRNLFNEVLHVSTSLTPHSLSCALFVCSLRKNH